MSEPWPERQLRQELKPALLPEELVSQTIGDMPPGWTYYARPYALHAIVHYETGENRLYLDSTQYVRLKQLGDYTLEVTGLVTGYKVDLSAVPQGQRWVPDREEELGTFGSDVVWLPVVEFTDNREQK